MTDLERLIVEQAIYNAIGADLKTGVPDNLRGRVNSGYLDAYEQTGATSFDVHLLGQKVGTHTFPRVKGRPARTFTELRVVDLDALRTDASPEFAEWLKAAVAHDLADYAIAYCEETGELLDGIEYVERVEPGTPDGIRPNGTLRVDAKRVAEVLGPALPATVAGLLGGGE